MKRRIRVGHLYDYGHDCARAVFNARFLLWNHVNFGECTLVCTALRLGRNEDARIVPAFLHRLFSEE